MKRTLDVPVERVMTLNPAAVGDDALLEQAAGLMVEGGFRHLPVIDPDGRVSGMISERELRAKLGVEVERFPEASPGALAERVEAAMRPDPVTVPSGTTLRDAMEILEDERIGAVPVVDERERLSGILSYVDVFRFLREQDRDERIRSKRVATEPAGASREERRGTAGAGTGAAAGRATTRASRTAGAPGTAPLRPRRGTR